MLRSPDRLSASRLTPCRPRSETAAGDQPTRDDSAVTTASTTQARATTQVGAPAHNATTTITSRAIRPEPRASTGARFWLRDSQ